MKRRPVINQTDLFSTGDALTREIARAYESTVRGTAGKHFVARLFGLTAGNELAYCDSRPVTLFTARKIEIRGRKSDALDVEIYAAADVPPAPDGMKRITELRGFQIVSVDKSLFDFNYLTHSAPTDINEPDIAAPHGAISTGSQSDGD